MNEIVYRKIAEIVCFICHGKCCKEGMVFEYDGKKAVVIRKDHNKCLSWISLTGRCRCQLRKPDICWLWKCRTLNVLSRLLNQRVWDGVM